MNCMTSIPSLIAIGQGCSGAKRYDGHRTVALKRSANNRAGSARWRGVPAPSPLPWKSTIRGRFGVRDVVMRGELRKDSTIIGFGRTTRVCESHESPRGMFVQNSSRVSSNGGNFGHPCRPTSCTSLRRVSESKAMALGDTAARWRLL